MQKQLDLSHINHLCWDYDGVKYKYEEFKTTEIFQICNHSAALTATSLVQDLKYEAAYNLAVQSYRNHSDCISAFIPHFEKAGLSAMEARELMHDQYHQQLFEIICEDHPHVIAACPIANALYASVPDHITHSILSHGSKEHFIIPFLESNGRIVHFNQDYIFDLKAINYQNKHLGPGAINLVMNKVGAQPHETAFIEDSVKNLQVAKLYFPEITTILINDNTDQKIAGVDVIVSSYQDVLKALPQHQPALNLSRYTNPYPLQAYI